VKDKTAPEKIGVANIITLVRVLLIPLFLVAFLSSWPVVFKDSATLLFALRPWIAAAVFVLISLTDVVDGMLARKRGEVTTFGKFMDPLADKLLITAALLALVQTRSLPAWIALVIIAREFVVSGLRMVASAEGVVIAASKIGKAKTVVQTVAIVMFMVKNHTDVLGVQTGSMIGQGFGLLAWGVMLAAVALTLISMWDYFRHANQVLEGPWS